MKLDCVVSYFCIAAISLVVSLSCIQVIDNKPYYLEMAGNLIPIAKTEEQLNVVFRAFVENRLAFPVRIRDSIREPSARLSFMQEPRQKRGQTAVCTLIVSLPDFVPPDVNANLEKPGMSYITSNFLRSILVTVAVQCNVGPRSS